MSDPDRLTRLLDAGEPCPQPDAPNGWWVLPAAVLLGAAVWCGLILAVW